MYISDFSNHRVRLLTMSTGIITTVAGNGVAGFGGDGGSATSASLNAPWGLAIDAGGNNLFISEFDNHRIRLLDISTGHITTVVGYGMAAFSGDGGPGTSSSLNSPLGLAVDATGNLIIGDTHNQRIRMLTAPAQRTLTPSPSPSITPSASRAPSPSSTYVPGVMRTLAGSGAAGSGGDGGPATSASMYLPHGVALDAGGNVFFADADNNRIRMINSTTGVIATVAGNGAQGFSGDGVPATSASLNNPIGVFTGPGDSVFIADYGNHRIRLLYIFTGFITTVAGNAVRGFSGDGGPATSASLDRPHGGAFDAVGLVYFPDTHNHRVRVVNLNSGIISTVAGNGVDSFGGDGGPATSASINFPTSVALRGGSLYIADHLRIRLLTLSTGIITTVAGNGVAGFSGDGGPALSASLNGPWALATDAGNNVFFSDYNNHRVRLLTLSTGIITTVAGNGVAAFSGDGGPGTSASLYNPAGLAFDSGGNLIIADRSNIRIRMLTAPAQRTPTPSAMPSSLLASVFTTQSPSNTGSSSSTGSQTGTGSASATPSRSAMPSVSGTLPPNATATATASRSASPSAPICRGLPAVLPLSGTSGTVPPRSTAAGGSHGMYTAGSCAVGYKTFFPGSRLLYALDLGSATPLGGTLTLTTCGHSANNTVLYVGTGCPSWALPFGCLAGNDNAASPACGGNAFASTVALVAQQSNYYVQLGGMNGVDVVSGLSWGYAPPPLPASASVSRSRSRSSSASRTRSRSASRSRTRKAK